MFTYSGVHVRNIAARFPTAYKAVFACVNAALKLQNHTRNHIHTSHRFVYFSWYVSVLLAQAISIHIPFSFAFFSPSETCIVSFVVSLSLSLSLSICLSRSLPLSHIHSLSLSPALIPAIPHWPSLYIHACACFVYIACGLTFSCSSVELWFSIRFCALDFDSAFVSARWILEPSSLQSISVCDGLCITWKICPYRSIWRSYTK